MFSFNLYCFHFNGVDIYVSRGHKATSWYQHCFFLPHWRCNVAVLSSKYWESEDILKDEEAFFLQRFGGMGIDSNWKIKSGQLLLNFSPRDWADIGAKLFSYLWIFNNLCTIKCLYALNPLSFDEVSRRLFSSCPNDQIVCAFVFHALLPITGTTIAWRVTACHSCAIERFMAHESSRIISLLMVDFCLVGYFGKQWCEIGSHVHSLPCVGHCQG